VVPCNHHLPEELAILRAAIDAPNLLQPGKVVREPGRDPPREAAEREPESRFPLIDLPEAGEKVDDADRECREEDRFDGAMIGTPPPRARRGVEPPGRAKNSSDFDYLASKLAQGCFVVGGLVDVPERSERAVGGTEVGVCEEQVGFGHQRLEAL